MRAAIESQAAMDLVGDQHQVVADAELGPERQFVAAIDTPGRVLRIAEQHQFRADGRLFEGRMLRCPSTFGRWPLPDGGGL